MTGLVYVLAMLTVACIGCVLCRIVPNALERFFPTAEEPAPTPTPEQLRVREELRQQALWEANARMWAHEQDRWRENGEYVWGIPK